MARGEATRQRRSTIARAGMLAGGVLLAAQLPIVATIAGVTASAETRAACDATRGLLERLTAGGHPSLGVAVLRLEDGELRAATDDPVAADFSAPERTALAAAVAAAERTGTPETEVRVGARSVMARRLADGAWAALPSPDAAPLRWTSSAVLLPLAAGSGTSLLLLLGGGLFLHRRLARPLLRLGRLLVDRADPDTIRAAVPGDGEVATVARHLADVFDDLAARRTAEQRLALVASRTSNAVAVTDAAGRVEWANDALHRLLAARGETGDPIGRPLARLLPDRRRAERGAGHARGAGAGAAAEDDSFLVAAIDGGAGGRGELRLQDADGAATWLGVDAQPIVDDDGVRGFVVVLTDLTAERSLRQAVEATTRELEAILDAVPTPVMLRDERGRLVRCNAAAARLLGADDAHELAGRDYADLAPDHASAALAADRQVLVTGLATWGVPERMEAGDGSRRRLEVDRVPLGGDGDEVSGVLAVANDVTDRTSLESRLDVAMRAGGLGVWEWEPHRGAMTLSTALREMLGGDHGGLDATFDGFFGRLHPEDRDRAIAAADRAVSGRDESFRCEVRLRPTGDAELWAMLAGRVAARGPDGRAERVVGVLVDIDRQKREQSALADALERAEAAGRARTAFLASMSHELRTPLTAILGYGELLHDPGCGESERRSHAGTILRNGRHLISIIDDVLDMSRIEAGRLETRPEAADLGAVVRDVIDMLHLRAEAKGLAVRTELDGPVPLRVETDPVRLRQVLLNLVGNAVKFTARGEVRLRIGAVRDDAGLGRLRISVSDTGPGIRPEVRERLFKPFERADDAMNRAQGGTGLGLAISLRLARMLGGDIRLESEPGAGSTFTVEVAAGPIPPLPDAEAGDGQREPADGAVDVAWTVEELLAIRMRPAAASEDEGGAATGGSGAASRRPLEGRRILLAEDGPDNQRLISHHLRSAGAVVDIADDGQAALELVRATAEEAPYDLVVMDMQMPRIDGYEATRRLRAEGHDLPVVALTAHAMTGDRERCLAAGCTDYATKPIDRLALVARCAELSVRARRARRAA